MLLLPTHLPTHDDARAQVTIVEDPDTSLAAGRINPVAVVMGAQTNDSNKELLVEYENAYGNALSRLHAHVRPRWSKRAPTRTRRAAAYHRQSL